MTHTLFRAVLSALLLTSTLAVAQQETFDLATYTPPKGWDRSTQQGTVVYFHALPSGASCLIAVYESRAGAGTAQAEFRREWADLVVTPLGIQTSPQVNQAAEGAWAVVTGSVSLERKTGPGTTSLVAFVGQGRVASVLLNVDDASCQPAVDGFLGGFGLKTKAPAAAPPVLAPRGEATPAPSAGGQASLVGSWMRGSVSGPALYDRNTGSFVGHASGSGRSLELKSNGEASMMAVLETTLGCTTRLMTYREGTWSANGSVLTLVLTSGNGESRGCSGKVSKFKPKLGPETYPYGLGSFEGTPALDLHITDNDVERLYLGHN